MYYYIEPEVSGGLGENSVVDTSVHPPVVSKLHYQFDGWLGDDLLETFPCYIITEQLKDEIDSTGLSGCQFYGVEVTKSDQFDELYPGKELPGFYWLKINGKAGKEDFGIADDHRLVVSEKTMLILKKNNIDQADIEEF